MNKKSETASVALEAQSSLYEYRVPWYKRLRKAIPGLNSDGHEVPDPVPLAPPVGYVRRPSLHDQIRQMIQSEKLRQEAQAAGFETMEEADDFDIDDEIDPSTPYEAHFHPPTGDEGQEKSSSQVVSNPQEKVASQAEPGEAPASPSDAPAKPVASS